MFAINNKPFTVIRKTEFFFTIWLIICACLYAALYAFGIHYVDKTDDFSKISGACPILFKLILFYILCFLTINGSLKLHYLFKKDVNRIDEFNQLHYLLWKHGKSKIQILISSFIYTWSGAFFLMGPPIIVILINLIFSINNLLVVFISISQLIELIFLTILIFTVVFSWDISIAKFFVSTIIFSLILCSCILYLTDGKQYILKNIQSTCVNQDKNKCCWGFSEFCDNCKFKIKIVNLVGYLHEPDNFYDLTDSKKLYDEIDIYIMKKAYIAFSYFLITLMIIIFDYIFLYKQFNYSIEFISNNVLNDQQQLALARINDTAATVR